MQADEDIGIAPMANLFHVPGAPCIACVFLPHPTAPDLAMSNRFTLRLLPDSLAVCRLEPEAAMPWWATVAPFFSVTRTNEELSIVCAASRVPRGTTATYDWRAMQLHGRFHHNLFGLMDAISKPLAGAGVSILVIASFDTHYVLVREAQLGAAVAALHDAGHRVLREQPGAPVGP